MIDKQEQIGQYIINSFLIRSSSFAKKELLTSFYKENVNKLVLNEEDIKNSKERNNGYYSNSPLKSSDADYRDGFYYKTDRWNGHMSSSLSNSPVMCTIKFIGGEYVQYDGSVVLLPNIEFENVIISMKQTKNIKKTTITGRNTGTVKEYSGNGDWEISLRAIVSYKQSLNKDIVEQGLETGIYPIDNMALISQLINCNVSVRVECWYLNKIANVDYVIIDSDCDISQSEGSYEDQIVKINLLSDNPIIINFYA